MAKPAEELIRNAVVQNHHNSTSRLLDKAFAFAFKGLVYAQIWEDPVVDMDALAITPHCRIITIASGGCNALSYLMADPKEIIAVDLNTAHVALNRLKIAAVRHLPDYAHFSRFFAEADSEHNIAAYHRYLAPHIDESTQRYWEGRDLVGRRRIGGFSRGIYKRGLLGGFIGIAHLLAKLYRIDPREILEASSIEEQRRIFEEKFAPLFERRFIRWLTDQPASLFGLGIPPAQYVTLAGDARMATVLRSRLEKLACHFAINDNYFAWQAFSRGYGRSPARPLPPYLQEEHFGLLRQRIGRLDIRHANITEQLATQADGSMDCYVLLDAQDWMNDEQLVRLWTEILRTARKGARVIFRTAAEHTLLPGRVPEHILSRWHYAQERSRALTNSDRSSIYGGVHLYELAR